MLYCYHKYLQERTAGNVYTEEVNSLSELSGTKELIFDTFVKMTSNVGYENVSIRDIAREVPINPASMYYHFESKGKMLEYAYNYYAEHQYDNRRPLHVMEKMIETASAQEIINAFTYTLTEDDPKKYLRMILITKIIYMRLFQDPIANALFDESNMNHTEYIISVLKHGISVGRIDGNFDIESFAEVLIGSMQIMGIKSFADIAYMVGQLEQEKRILALVTRLLGAALK